MSKKLEKEFFETRNATQLAQDLLGNVLCYNDGTKIVKYLITVTEAYPYQNQIDNSGKEISYVNKYSFGNDGHDALIGKDKIGTIFIFGGMIHVVGKCESKGDFRCDNILIRGGIMLKDNHIVLADSPKMNFIDGMPWILCTKILNKTKGIGFEHYKDNNQIMYFETGLKICNNDIGTSYRIGIDLNNDNNRFFLKRIPIEVTA